MNTVININCDEICYPALRDLEHVLIPRLKNNTEDL